MKLFNKFCCNSFHLKSQFFKNGFDKLKNLECLYSTFRTTIICKKNVNLYQQKNCKCFTRNFQWWPYITYINFIQIQVISQYLNTLKYFDHIGRNVWHSVYPVETLYLLLTPKLMYYDERWSIMNVFNLSLIESIV